MQVFKRPQFSFQKAYDSSKKSTTFTSVIKTEEKKFHRKRFSSFLTLTKTRQLSTVKTSVCLPKNINPTNISEI